MSRVTNIMICGLGADRHIDEINSWLDYKGGRDGHCRDSKR